MAPIEPLKDSTPSPWKRARKEAVKNKLKEKAWLQKERNMATGVGASELRNSSISQEVDSTVL